VLLDLIFLADRLALGGEFSGATRSAVGGGGAADAGPTERLAQSWYSFAKIRAALGLVPGAVASSTRAPFRKHAVFEANPRRDSPGA